MTPPPAGVRDILIAARAKIEKPENWTTGAEARDAKGQVVRAKSPHAVCFCAEGAVLSVKAPLKATLRARELLANAVPTASGFQGIWAYNDWPHRQHRSIVKWFDRAIALAEPTS